MRLLVAKPRTCMEAICFELGQEFVRRLGIVVGGSLSKGLSVKLDRSAVVEGMAVGRYVVVSGQTGRRFFSIITDVALDSTNPVIEKTPPDTSDPFLAQVYQGTRYLPCVVLFGNS